MVGFDADAAARLVAEGARDQQLAELARLDRRGGQGPVAAGAALGAVLDDPVVPPRGLDGDPAFVDVVAARLFDVDVLARLAAPDRDQGVPVIGRGDRDGVDRLVLEDAADVLHGGRRAGRPSFAIWSSRFLYVRVSGSTRYVISTPGHSRRTRPTCSPPRPLSPATARRTVSLAPMTRPDDLVPPIAKPAPTPAAARERFMNWRRLRCDFDIALGSSSRIDPFDCTVESEIFKRRFNTCLLCADRASDSHSAAASPRAGSPPSASRAVSASRSMATTGRY